MLIQPSWQPKKRNVRYYDRPEWVPDWVYTEAQIAKKCYNEDWEFWVYQVSLEHNCSQAEAEDACIRGLKKAILQLYVVYGPKVGKWYEDFLEMGDIFTKVSHPNYIAQLTPLAEEGTK